MFCSICRKAFGENRRPHILKCGDVFCTACLKNLHSANDGVILCPECRGEEYYANVEDITIVRILEARVTSLSLEETQEEAARAEAPPKGAESPWDSCSVHKLPMSSWCRTCSISICDSCHQIHSGRGHEVFGHGEARELLLAKHDSRGRRNLHRWLSGVERATREAIEAAEDLLPRLRPTLSAVQHFLSQIDDQRQAVEDESSLKTLENLLEEGSRWMKRTQLAAQQEVDAAVSSLGRIESSMAELRRLQSENEGGLSQRGAASASPQGGEGEGEEEEGQDGAPPRKAVVAGGPPQVVVVARCQSVSLSEWKDVTLDLPSDLGTSCTTELEFKATRGFGGPTPYFILRYEKKRGRVRDWDFAGRRRPVELFWTVWHIQDDSDSVEMVTRDPTTGEKETKKKIPLRGRGCGLRWDTSHRVKVVEDALQYAVFLDGAEVDHVAKAAPRPPAANRVVVKTYYPQLAISNFVVKVEGAAAS